MSIQYNNSKLRGIFFNALIGILLLSFSICSSLIVAEVLLRTFHISVTPSEYSQRYLIDGYPSSETGYFTGDPVLPFALGTDGNISLRELPASRGMLDSTLEDSVWKDSFLLTSLELRFGRK